MLILKIVDREKDYVISTYACIEGLCGILMQGNHVICYEFEKLKEYKKNYAKYDLQLFPIVHMIKM